MKHVVLDTEVFRRENLAFDSARFERLAELVEENEVEVYLTDVVDGEVRRAITSQIHAGVELLREEPTRRTLNVLAKGAIPKLKDLLKAPKESELIETLIREYEDLLDRLDVEVISTDDVSVKTLRDQYFGVIPPFGHKAEKKHEFPDAISVLGVKKWAANRGEPVIMVSGDKGIAAALEGAEGIKHVPDLRDVIDAVLRILKVVADPEGLLEAKREEIETRVRDEFEHLGFYIDGEWGEVSEAIVESVHIGGVYLAERKENVVTLEFEAEIRYSASLTFDDPERTAYDSETGGTYVFGSVSRDIRDTAWVEGEVVLEIDIHDPSKSKVLSTRLNASDIAVPPPRDEDEY